MALESVRYDFRRQLSENPHTRAWLAVRRDTGALCFVKCASSTGELPIEEKHDLLRESFRLQARIRSTFVPTASALHVENGSVYIEYPFIPPERLLEIDPTVLLEPTREVLVRLAAIVDYLHLLGLVHCDLKLDNFRLLRHARGERLILVDLDHLQESGKPAGHRIFGTPECIPPEILNNDRVSGASDLFSLGSSLKLALGRTEGTGPETGATVGLEELIENLTRPSVAARPESLLSGLKISGLIDDCQYQHGLKTELGMRLLTVRRTLAAAGKLADADLQRDLFHEIKLFSIPDELCGELKKSLAAAPRRAWEATRRIVAAGECTRVGEFWHLSITDELLLKLFGELSPAGDASVLSNGVPARTGLRHYLGSKVRFHEQLAAGGTITSAELVDLSGQAVSMQRQQEACEFLRQAAEKATPASAEHIAVLESYVPQLVALGHYHKAREAARGAMALIPSGTLRAQFINLKRLHAMMTAYDGDSAGGEKELLEVIAEAEQMNVLPVLGKALGDLGALYLSSGRLDEAGPAYERAVQFITQHGLESVAATAFVSYASFSFQTARYEKAIALCKTILPHIDPERNANLQLIICTHIALAHTRLGEYGRADHWLGRSLGLVQKSSGHHLYTGHYGNTAWVKMVRGELAEAELLYRQRVLALGPSGVPPFAIYYALKNLGEMALYRGNVAEFDRLAAQLHEALAKLPNRIIASELELLEALQEIYYGSENGLDHLGELAAALMQRQNRYYAAVGLLVLLVESDESRLRRDRDNLKRLVDQVPDIPVPLFQAIRCLAPSFLSDEASVEVRVTDATRAYRHLESAGQWFFAMLVCAAIARLHFASYQPRLGARFTRQAVSLADRLANRPFAARLDRRLKEKTSLVQERRALVQSFDGIADILAGVGRELDPLPRLLKFAVSAVEAERGVLLLTNLENDELRVRAYVGCEAEDLDDVVSFSRNIPRAALSTMSPVFISDALTDTATNKYKSIIAHNIRSVLCVPIVVDGRGRGVIYLDHHTIPALFDEEDLTFVGALSKFASIVFETYSRLRLSKHQAAYLESGLTELGLGSEFITRNESLRKLLTPLPQIALSDAGVLIRGESGTGKEIICHMIHSLSPRQDGPFIKLNCAAIAPTLVESELFGVADRTATGVGARKGKFEAADGGTLFLDEIGDMPLDVQAKVLRVLEYQEFEAVGSNKTISTDVRFVFATNKNLEEMIRRKEFRDDLYYRICGVNIVIPPLRERPDDVEPLTRHFIALFARTTGKPIALSSRALSVLESYGWPGNVRELRNVIERLSLLHPGETIAVDHLPADMVFAADASEPSSNSAEAAEKARMIRALEKCRGNQSAAARLLKMSLSTFRRKLTRYGLRPPE